MKKLIWSLFLFTAITLLCVECYAQSATREKRNESGFTGVSFGLAGNLYIKTGSGFDVTLEGNSNYLEDVETIVRDGRLIIREGQGEPNDE